MRENNKYSERLYEWLDPEERFVGMADVIINRHGSGVPFANPYAPQKKIALWLNTANENFRLSYTDKGESGGQEYMLEKTVAGVVLDRYFVKQFRGEVKPFEKIEEIDGRWRSVELSEEQKAEEVRNALGILARKNAFHAQRLLGEALMRRFPEIAATYILSDLAVETDEPTVITELVVPEQRVAFDQKWNEFEDLMGKYCTNYDGTFDQELHNNLYHGPEPDGRNSYAKFDLRSAMISVAKTIGASWQNRITRDHPDFIK